ncbi:MAG: nicotinate-nucleotide adenylyltransferase [Clostridiales bacterium]|nr:nicotinate-nucleotide adenylyltransferase [Clostridiales bacterium]
MSRIGIMGGTFDPIHYGHLVLSEQVRSEFDLDKIIFVPAGIPPHKNKESVTENMHRYFMTVLATIHNPNFTVSDIEVKSEEVSYTIYTIETLKRMNEYEEMYFIVGADAILEIETWKDYDKLLGSCHFVAGTRPGNESQALVEKIEMLRNSFNAKIHLLKVPALDISSTDIRNSVAAGKSIKYLVPDAVEQYIYKNGLYK